MSSGSRLLREPLECTKFKPACAVTSRKWTLARVDGTAEAAAFASLSQRVAAPTRGAVASQRKKSRRITWPFLLIGSRKATASNDRTAPPDEPQRAGQAVRQIAPEDQR